METNSISSLSHNTNLCSLDKYSQVFQYLSFSQKYALVTNPNMIPYVGKKKEYGIYILKVT